MNLNQDVFQLYLREILASKCVETLVEHMYTTESRRSPIGVIKYLSGPDQRKRLLSFGFATKTDIENGFRTGSADYIHELDASRPGWKTDMTWFTISGKEYKPTCFLEEDFLTYVLVHILFQRNLRGPEIEFEVPDLWE